MTSSTKFSTPWKVTLNGAPVPPCDLVEVYERHAISPNPAKPDHRPWCLEKQNNWQDTWPKGRDAFVESVTMIWRLKEQEEKGGESEEWKMNVEAWLTRHRELCDVMDIDPNQAVVDFARAAGVMKNISATAAGMFDQPSTPVPEPTPRPRATTSTELEQKMAEKPAQGTADDSGESNHPTPKGKSVAVPDVVTPKPNTSRFPTEGPYKFDGLDTGIKRGPPKSPPSVTNSSKRPRTTAGSCKEPYDFSNIEVDEGTSPTDRVPEAIGVRCLNCVKKKVDCPLVWSIYSRASAIRCKTCIQGKAKCTFDDPPWKFRQWPIIRASREDDTRRAEAASKKSQGPKTVRASASEVARSVSEGAGAEGTPSRGRQLRRAKRKRVASSSPVSSTGGPTATAISPSVPVVGAAMHSMTGITLFRKDESRFDGLVFQDLGRYEKCLTDTSQGPTILGERELQLGLTIQRERQALENLHTLVTGRAEIGRRLQVRFQRRLAQLEKDVGDDSRPRRTR